MQRMGLNRQSLCNTLTDGCFQKLTRIVFPGHTNTIDGSAHQK